MTLRFVACQLLALTTGFAQAQSWPSGFEITGGRGADLAAIMQSEARKWSKVILDANVKAE